jgi:hypothetical protein
MVRHQWISYLFFTAFAVALVHNILPHAHTREKTKVTASSHHHHGDHHAHSHKEGSKPALPVFTHFSNGDFIGSAKYSIQEKQQRAVLVFEQPIIISIALPTLAYRPSPVPHARDLPQKFFLSIQSLRAPPYFLS